MALPVLCMLVLPTKPFKCTARPAAQATLVDPAQSIKDSDGQI